MAAFLMQKTSSHLRLSRLLPKLGEKCSSYMTWHRSATLDAEFPARSQSTLRHPGNQMKSFLDIGSRAIFDEEHDMFRESVRKFIQQEVRPLQAKFEENGMATREVWRRMGEKGLYGTSIPSTLGGAGGTFKHEAIVLEELFYNDCFAPNVLVHSHVVLPYFHHFATQDQQKWFLPKLIAGQRVASLAMTEPSAGSDIQGFRTTAKKDGDDYILNGSKVFISNGLLADTHLVVALTDPTARSRAHGLSIFIVEDDMAGFSKGPNLVKMGIKGQDTTELFFDNVRVPSSHVLGEANHGFYYLMSSLPQERLSVAVSSAATMEYMFEITKDYVCQRHAFGRPLSSLQTLQHRLAELKTEISVSRAFVDECIVLHSAGLCSSATASMAKYWVTELENKVAAACVQMHGGYGYMMEQKIARMFCNSRVSTIVAGTTEIMKELIARSIVARA